MKQTAMSSKEITIYDIAKALDVSPSTVSRGLNGDDNIGNETRKRVIAAANRMGYQRNAFAMSLRSNRTNTLGVIVPRVNSYLMSTVIAGMEKVTNARGYMLVISQSQENVKKETALINSFFNSRVEGLLVSLAADGKNLNHFNRVFDKDIPVVFFDRIADHPKGATVVIDNFKAGYDATSHLIDQGCRRIVFIGGSLNSNVYADRLKGFEQALSHNDLIYDSANVISGELTEDTGRKAAAQILTMNPLPDGVFASNDTAAVSFVVALKEAGIKVPEQIAVVGFNNDPVSSVLQPGLTTIAYPGHEMGEAAANNIINAIDNQTMGMYKSIVLKHKLVVRQSSLKPKDKSICL